MFLHERPSKDGSPRHTPYADQGEQADDERVVMVRRPGQQEGKSGPETRKGGGGEETNQTRLGEHGILCDKFQDIPEQEGILLDNPHIRVCRRVIRHEQIQQDQDDVLQRERNPVYISPADVLRDDARKEPGAEHAE